MKTLTEFDGFSLRNAMTKKQELLASGKTPEELPQAMGEALKVEGDRLSFLLAALAVIEGRSDNLKRVVVYSVDEGKAAPKGTVEKDGKHFLAEYFFVPQAKKEQRRDGRRPRDGKGRGKKRGGRDGRNRGPRREAGAGTGGAPGTPEAAPKRNDARRPRRDNRGGSGRPDQKPSVKPIEKAEPKTADSSTKTE